MLVKDGKVVHVVSREGSRGLLPEIHSMTPACVSSTQMEAVKITGANIAGHGQTVLCRSQGTLHTAFSPGPPCQTLVTCSCLLSGSMSFRRPPARLQDIRSKVVGCAQGLWY